MRHHPGDIWGSGRMRENRNQTIKCRTKIKQPNTTCKCHHTIPPRKRIKTIKIPVAYREMSNTVRHAQYHSSVPTGLSDLQRVLAVPLERELEECVQRLTYGMQLSCRPRPYPPSRRARAPPAAARYPCCSPTCEIDVRQHVVTLNALGDRSRRLRTRFSTRSHRH